MQSFLIYGCAYPCATALTAGAPRYPNCAAHQFGPPKGRVGQPTGQRISSPRLTANDKVGIFAIYPTGIPIAVIGSVSGQDPYRTGDNAWFKTRIGYYVWCNTVGHNISALP